MKNFFMAARRREHNKHILFYVVFISMWMWIIKFTYSNEYFIDWIDYSDTLQQRKQQHLVR